MTVFAIICCAVSALSTAALVPSTVDPKLWRAVRGRYVRAVELTAATAGALTVLGLFALGWLADALTSHGEIGVQSS